MSRDSAIFTRSARDRACIFLMRLPRWIFTVISLRPSSAAICLFMSPAVTSLITSRSRGLSDSWRLFQSRFRLLLLAPEPVAVDRCSDRVQHVLITKRLGQEIDGARLHG